jgi:hypothetical protein
MLDEGKPYGASLVAGHFLHFAEDVIDLAKCSVKSAVAAGSFIAKQRINVAKARAAAGNNEQAFHNNLRLLQVCDTLSILLCSDFIGEHKIEDVPFLEAGNTLNVSRKSDNLTLTLSPLPFKKNLRDHVNSYVIPRKIYSSDEELQSTVHGTKASNNEVHLGGA